MAQLSISNVITVSLANAQAGLNEFNTGNLVLFTNEVPGASFGVGSYQAYPGPTQVGVDFGTSSETFAMANAIFSQQPNILLPGGQLYIVPLLAGVQTLTFNGVAASGAFEVTYAGGTSDAINWNDPAATIQATLRAVPGLGEVTVTGSIASQSLVITMAGLYGPATVGITADTLETSGSVAVTVTPSVTTVAETIAAAITRTQSVLQYFAAISTVILDQADTLAAAAVAQPLNMLLGVVSNNSSDLTPSTGTFAQIVSGSFNHTRCLYYGANVATLSFSAVPASGSFEITYGPATSASIASSASAATIQSDLQAMYGLGAVTVSGSLASQNLQINMLGTQGPSVLGIASNSLVDSDSNAITVSIALQQSDPLVFLASYFGAGLSVDFEGSNTTITQNLKSFVGVLPDLVMTQTVQNSCTAVGADTYPSIQGDPACLSAGANLFFDQAQNRIWFMNAIAIAGYNYLAQTNSKIPQTEDGMSGLKSAYREVCKVGITNQYIAPGTWKNPTTFGNQALLYANISQKGYYLYSTPISQQTVAELQARKAPLVQIAINEAGAIQSSSVLINVMP